MEKAEEKKLLRDVLLKVMLHNNTSFTTVSACACACIASIDAIFIFLFNQIKSNQIELMLCQNYTKFIKEETLLSFNGLRMRWVMDGWMG